MADKWEEARYLLNIGNWERGFATEGMPIRWHEGMVKEDEGKVILVLLT